MAKILIPKSEYKQLVEKARRYEYFRQVLEEDIFAAPPTRNAKTVIKEFHAAGRYNKKFLESLDKGLKRSAYFK